MSERDNNYLVFTDLDATLLDHDTYSWQPAAPAVQSLKERAFPLILNSSKTLSEMISLAGELETEAPLVCENGALVAVPVGSPLSGLGKFDELRDGYEISYLGSSRVETLKVLKDLREATPTYLFKGYNEWSVEEVAEITGLTLEGAEKSKDRLGTEPIHWLGSEEDFSSFQEELKQASLTAVVGGRFIHISGAFTKASGISWLLERYQQAFPEVTWKTVALGDSPNDTAMLSAADIAVVIPNHTPLSPTSPRVIYADEQGPTGWNTEILKLLTEL